MLSMNFLNAIIEFPNAIARFSYECFCNTFKSGGNVILKKTSHKKNLSKKRNTILMINAGRDPSFTNANSNNNGKMYSFT